VVKGKKFIVTNSPSPDSSGNPFVAVFAIKDWERIAGTAPKNKSD